MLIEGDEAAVERADIDFAAVESAAAVHHVATDEIGSLAGNFRVVSPFHLAGLGIDGEHYAPRTCCVDDAILDDRRGFEPTCGPKFRAPHQAESGDSLLINLVE